MKGVAESGTSVLYLRRDTLFPMYGTELSRVLCVPTKNQHCALLARLM
jgi:hypothetical protein